VGAARGAAGTEFTGFSLAAKEARCSGVSAKSPFETHAGRLHTISLSVKSAVYGCIACVVFVSFTFTLDLLDLKRWMPFAQSVLLVIVAFQCLMGLTAPPHESEADGLGSNPGS
jgi:hypothetical protein